LFARAAAAVARAGRPAGTSFLAMLDGVLERATAGDWRLMVLGCSDGARIRERSPSDRYEVHLVPARRDPEGERVAARACGAAARGEAPAAVGPAGA
jgi:hypothetical protein